MSQFKFNRKIVFLKDILSASLSSFGGPEMHLSVFQKKFVEEKAYITNKELLELNSLTQILPGPSSTQTLICIAYKMGGPSLAFLSLLIWVLPAAFLMSLFAISTNTLDLSIFKFLGPMALAFITYAAFKMTKSVKLNQLSISVIIISAICSFLFHTPYLFPVLLIFGAFINVNFGDKNFVPNKNPLKNIKWANLTLMLGILIFAAILGALTKNQFPQISEPIRLFENTYRMGSMVFGGGNVLNSMILTEFVEFKQKQYLTHQEFTTGLGLLQAIPGPTFTLATFANGIAMKKMGYDISGQLIGCGIGTIAVFLPGTLLIFFLYPIWGQIKTYPIIYRSLDGIIFASIGFLWSSVLVMSKPYFYLNYTNNIISWISLLIFAMTILLLRYTKIPALLIVIMTIVIGFIF